MSQAHNPVWPGLTGDQIAEVNRQNGASTDARPLYEIKGEMEGIIRQLEEMELPEEEVNKALTAYLEGAGDELREKLDSYCMLIQNRAALAKARREEGNAMIALAQFDEKLCEKLKERMKDFFETAGIQKFPTLHFQPNIRGNGGESPMKIAEEVVKDPTILPAKYQKVMPDVEAIRADLKTGITVLLSSGEKSAAWLEDRGTHIRLR